MRDPASTLPKMAARALARRCPRCGNDRIFDTYFELHDRCPGCGLAFEREPGYWVGAMIIVTTITFALFILVLVGGMVVTWPDVPWGWLLGVTLGVNLIIPVVTYPQAKMLWAAMELRWHPLEPAEIKAAAEAVERQP